MKNDLLPNKQPNFLSKHSKTKKKYSGIICHTEKSTLKLLFLGYNALADLIDIGLEEVLTLVVHKSEYIAETSLRLPHLMQ